MKPARFRLLPVLLGLVLLVAVLPGCGETATYTVTFDSNGGTPVEPQTVEANVPATQPADPQKNGFTFLEWQQNGIAYDFSAPVTGDITLIAHYSVNEGTELVLVVLDYQNGDMSGVVEIEKGSSLSAPPVPVRPGYTFVGWYAGETAFDFTTTIQETITLTAKWTVDAVSTTGTTRRSGHAFGTTTQKLSGNTGTTAGGVSAPSDSVTDPCEALTQKYTGRWYLDGYADVCIDISKRVFTDTAAMQLHAYNFSLPIGVVNSLDTTDAYVVYPGKAGMSGWGGSATIPYNNWSAALTAYKLVLGNDCLYLNNQKFVPSPGEKDKYYDTCYRQALGTWYLENNPDAFIEVYTATVANDLGNGDRFGIRTTHFNLYTLKLTTTTGDVQGGRADRKSSWEELGISVSDNRLTVTNKNGTKIFYKSQTAVGVTGVALNASALTVAPGETKTLTATVKPADAYDRSILWTSSDPTVATVSVDGKVTGNKEGTVTVTVTTKDGGYTAACRVTVATVRVSGISLDKTALTMTVGDTEQLLPTVIPANAADKRVTWISSNAAVVQVSHDGKLVAKASGSATVTATAADGGYTATCTVTVKDPALTVKASIAMETRVTGSAAVRGIRVTVTADGGTGIYAEYTVRLYRDGVLVGEVADKELFVTPFRNGTYTAEVSVKDSAGNEATASATTTFSV